MPKDKRENLKRSSKRLSIYTVVAGLLAWLGVEASPEQISWIAGAVVQVAGVIDFIISIIKDGELDEKEIQNHQRNN